MTYASCWLIRSILQIELKYCWIWYSSDDWETSFGNVYTYPTFGSCIANTTVIFILFPKNFLYVMTALILFDQSEISN